MIDHEIMNELEGDAWLENTDNQQGLTFMTALSLCTFRRALLCIHGRLPLPVRVLLQVEDLLCISVTVEKRLEKVD